MPKHTLLNFSRTDGTSSVWPECGRLSDGGTLDFLSSDDGYAVQFLGRLADHLAKLLNYPGTYTFLHSPGQSSAADPGGIDGENVEIGSLPDGYGLFGRSTKDGRQDKYLRGTLGTVSTRELTLTKPQGLVMSGNSGLPPSLHHMRPGCSATQPSIGRIVGANTAARI